MYTQQGLYSLLNPKSRMQNSQGYTLTYEGTTLTVSKFYGKLRIDITHESQDNDTEETIKKNLEHLTDVPDLIGALRRNCSPVTVVGSPNKSWRLGTSINKLFR